MKWIIYILCLVHIVSIIRKRVVDEKNDYCSLVVQKHSFYLVFEDTATHEMYYSGSHMTIRMMNVSRSAPHNKVSEWFARRITMNIDAIFSRRLPYWLNYRVTCKLPTRCRPIRELYDELINDSDVRAVTRITNDFKTIVITQLKKVS